MRQFLKNIAQFLILIAIINFGLYVIVYQVYIKEYTAVNKTFKTYILSDSHGLALENAPEKYGAYNFSNHSESYHDLKTKLKYLIRESKIEKLILGVDNHSLSKYRDGTNNSDRSAFISTSDDYPNYLSYLNARYINSQLVLLNTKEKDILINYFKSLGSQQNRKTAWHELSDTERIKRTLSRVDVQFPDSTGSSELRQTLHEILNICSKNNISVLCVKFPVTQSYYESTNQLSYGIDNLIAKHDIPMLDFRKLYFNRPELFRDQDHLNSNGGKLFSDYLFQKIVPTYWLTN